MDSSTLEVFIWEDGSWCFSDEILPKGKESEEYVRLEVEDSVEDIDDYVAQTILEVNLGESCDKRHLFR